MIELKGQHMSTIRKNSQGVETAHRFHESCSSHQSQIYFNYKDLVTQTTTTATVTTTTTSSTTTKQ